jgi:hypothetical protein
MTVNKTAGAKAQLSFLPFAARLKSCPDTKQEIFAACEVVPLLQSRWFLLNSRLLPSSRFQRLANSTQETDAGVQLERFGNSVDQNFFDILPIPQKKTRRRSFDSATLRSG